MYIPPPRTEYTRRPHEAGCRRLLDGRIHSGVDLTADLTLAARRNEAKQAVAAVLARYSLPSANRRAILLNLAVDPAAVGVTPPVAQWTPPAGPTVRAAKRGRPRKAINGTGAKGPTHTLMATLGPEPGMPIRKLSTAVYGDDSQKNRNKTRSLLNSLKKQGKVDNPETGKWKVTS